MVLHNKNHGKTAERKRAEIHELEVQMAKKFLCGGCHIGFDKKEDYEAHTTSEEHNYHIMRKINTLVPGLAFCAACSCVIQTAKGWESHVLTDKHARCTQSLLDCGIDGEYDEPLGCTSAGQIGLPIPTAQIDIKKATSHGYGHGGKMGAGIPMIGLDKIFTLNAMKYKCGACMETFTFEHRGNHLGGVEHRINYLRSNYPAWHMDVSSIDPANVMQIKFRLMFYAHKIEAIEKQTERPQSKTLREKFSLETTQRRAHNVGKERNERGYYPKPPQGEAYGNVVFVKQGEKDVPTYVMRNPMPAVKKTTYDNSKTVGGEYSSGQIKAIVAGAESEEFAQGSKMVFKVNEKKLLLVTPDPSDAVSKEPEETTSKESTIQTSSLKPKDLEPSSSDAAKSDPGSAKEVDPNKDTAVQAADAGTEKNTITISDTESDTGKEKEKPVLLVHSSRQLQDLGLPQQLGRAPRDSHRPPRGRSPPSLGHQPRGVGRGQRGRYGNPAMMHNRDDFQLQEDCLEEDRHSDVYGYDHQDLAKRTPTQLMERPPYKKPRSSYQYDHEEEYYQPEGPPRHPHMGRGRGSSRGDFGPPLHGPRRPSGPPRPPAPHRLPGPRGPPREGHGPGRGYGPPRSRGFRHPHPQDAWGPGSRHPY